MTPYNFVPKMKILILTCLPTHYNAFHSSLETIGMKFSIPEALSIQIITYQCKDDLEIDG